MSDYEKVRGVELRAVNLNIKRSLHSVKTKRSTLVPEHDTQSLPPQDSFHDQLEEHIGLVGASSHEPSNVPIPDSQPRINWFDASMHLIKGNLGPGCLNLPHAFAHCGWLLGTFLLLVVVIQGIYSMTLLAELKQILLDSNYRTHTFMDVAQASLGSRGHRFVQIFLFVLQSGVCCVFLDLIATNLKSQTSLSTNTSILLVTGALLLIVHVRYMKDLRFLSTSANLFMITAVLTAAVTAVIDIGTHDIALPPRSTSDLGEVATFTSTLFFSFEGIGLVLPIENAYTVASIVDEAKQANYFYRTRVLPGAMVAVGILFWITGFFTSWAFPDIHNGSITAYLHEAFPDNSWYNVVNMIVMLAVFLTFPLQVTPALEVLEEWCQPAVSLAARDTSTDKPNPIPADRDGDARDSWGEFNWIIPRYCIVLGSAILVLLVDDMGLLMALFGAVGQTGLAMMPCLCHLALQRKGVAPKQRSKTLMNLLTITCCTLVMFFGLIATVRRIIKRFEETSKESHRTLAG